MLLFQHSITMLWLTLTPIPPANALPPSILNERNLVWFAPSQTNRSTQQTAELHCGYHFVAFFITAINIESNICLARWSTHSESPDRSESHISRMIVQSGSSNLVLVAFSAEHKKQQMLAYY